MAGAVTVLLFAGALLTWWTVHRTDREMRESLLQQTRLITNAVNIEHVKALTGGGEDLEKTDYEQIKAQLTAVKHASDKCRFVYLMGCRTDGMAFFYVDSEPPGSKAYSPPGQVYEEVPDDYLHVFRTGSESVVGPVTDRWGTWVSGLIPINDPQTGSLIAVLGMDVDASAWKRAVLAAAAGPTGLTLATLALLGLSALLAQSRRRILLQQESLRESRDLLDDTQQLAKIGGWEWDVARQTMTWTDETYRIHGLEPGDIPPGSAAHILRSLACYDADDRPVIEAAFRRCAKEGEAYDLEFPITSVQGRRAWIQTTARPVFDGKRIVKVVGNIADITERRQSQEALRESCAKNLKEQEFNQLLLDTSPAFIVAIGFDGKTLMMNRSLLNAVEYTSDEARNTDYLKTFVPEEDRRAVALVFQRIVAEKKATLNENRIMGKSGKTYSVEWYGRIVDSEGENSGVFVGVGIDITDRRRAEQDLRESEDRFRLLAELAPVGIVISDSEEKTLYASPKFVELFGYTEDDMPSIEAWWPLAYPDPTVREGIRQQWKTALDEAREGGAETLPMEFPVTCKDGKVRNIEFRLSTTGALNFVVFTDVTERRRAEEELKREQELVEKILDSMPGIFYLYTYPQLRLVRWNKNHETLLGYESGEIANRCIMDWHIPDARPAVHEAVEYAMEAGHNVLESPLLSKDGRSIPFLMTGVRFDTPEQRYLMGIGIDITERRHAEAEREKLREQLTQSQKIESVGRLAGGVAHDFNNMLGVILGHTELALEKMDPADPRFADLQEVRKAAERSADLTRQLLAFARKQTVVPKVLDLNATVEGMLTMLRRLIGEDLDLAWLPGNSIRPIKMDPTQIDQILANLCVNARDAIGNTGKITIETDAAAFDDAYCAGHAGFVPGAYTLLAVSDDGCGMSKETLDNLFEPFFTTKEIGKGTGLGLATVYGIVKQNNGFIVVYSEPGHGTTFKIYLPCHIGKAEHTPKEVSTEPAARSQETILLVEDEPAILTLTTSMLERQGYNVMSASTPGAALRLAETHAGEIHLLMTDVVMPEMNGRELARNLLSLYPNAKRLFMSGYTANVIAHHGVLDEGVNFIQKPFSMKDLVAKIREVLDHE